MPIDEFRAQLAKHYARLAQITLSIGAQDGGSRTTFHFLDSHGDTIVVWEDWSFAINDIEQELRRSWNVVHRDGLGYAYTFHAHDRHRTPTTSATQP